MAIVVSAILGWFLNLDPFFSARFWDDGHIADGSTSDADLPIHGVREGCDCLVGE